MHTSRFSGQGVRVAVLDTGIDLDHPDFQGREIVTQSFINGQTVQDGHGHGTHCIGTACGPKLPASGIRRYGVAFGATIYAGKVLGSSTGGNGPIVAGIEWALANGCQVISLSISVTGDVQIDQYNVPIRRALEAGSLVVAAAGNNADRATGHFGFVGSPANAPEAMAVAALDNRLAMYNKSARSSTRTGEAGKINISGPGVGVFSTYPVARGTHRFWDGTSMATPHVAGIAALWIEARRKTGADLWRLLLEESLPFQGAQVLDVGSGMVQAPQ
ncbi:MAG: S8 family serine peptidase [Gammaproteobacteria bacterium]